MREKTLMNKNDYEWAVDTFVEGASKTDVINVLSILKKAHWFDKDFTARDFGFAGATLHSLTNLGILKVVDKHQYWVDIDDKTKKKVEVNVYMTTITEDMADRFINDIVEGKVNVLNRKINRLREALYEADTQLRKFQEIIGE